MPNLGVRCKKQFNWTSGIRADPRGGDSPPKTYENNFAMIFYNSENSISWYNAIFTSIVLSQRYCEVYFKSREAVNW